jgi:hypothetical protein
MNITVKDVLNVVGFKRAIEKVNCLSVRRVGTAKTQILTPHRIYLYGILYSNYLLDSGDIDII